MQLEQLAHQLKQIAKQELVLRFGKVSVQSKAAEFKAEEHVTEADLAASAALLTLVRSEFPESFTEEALPTQSLTAQQVWVFDPLDGTDEFIQGVSSGYACQGALLERQPDASYKPVAGIIYRPGTDELLYGTAQQVTYERDGVVLPLPQPLTHTMVGWVRGINPEPSVANWYRQIGAEVYHGGGAGACWMDLCTGRINLSLFNAPYSKMWDTAPIQPILEYLGGTISSATGQPLVYYPPEFYNRAGWLAQIGQNPIDTSAAPPIINA